MFKFDELEGYNSVLNYTNMILEAIKSLGEKKIDYENFKKLGNSKYEYANARLSSMLQSIMFFQLYEKYGKVININDTNYSKILKMIENIEIKASTELSVLEKEQVFRNILAYGRYTLKISSEGKLQVYFSDSDSQICGKNINSIEGHIDYGKFSCLAQTYIDSFNLEKTEIRQNKEFEGPKTTKNISLENLYKILFNSIIKIKYEYNRDFESSNRLSDVSYELYKDPSYEKAKTLFESMQQYSQKNYMLKNSKEPISPDEQEYLKKYMNFIGKKKFVKRLNQYLIGLRECNSVSQIGLKKFVDAYKNVNNFLNDLNVILESKNGKIIQKRQEDLNFFLNIIESANQLDSNELGTTKELDEFSKLIMGGITLSSHVGTRGNEIKTKIDNFQLIYPILYSNLLLLNAYYAIGYTNEVNNNYDKELFDYKNIDLSKFQIIYDDLSRPSIKVVDLHQNAQKSLKIKKDEERASKIKSIINDLGKGKNNFENIIKILSKEANVDSDIINQINSIKQETEQFYQEITTKSDEDKKAELIESDKLAKMLETNISFFYELKNLYPNSRGLQKMLESKIDIFDSCLENINKMGLIKNEIIELEKLVLETSGCLPYEDSSVFFAHIRNSITHSFFNINYDEMFETGDLSKIKYHIEDYDTRNNKKYKTFEIDLYAQDIIDLIEIMKNNVNSKASRNQDINNTIHLDDIRDDNGIQRYDITKYDSKSNPLPLKRPTNEDFESSVGEDALINGLNNNLLAQIKENEEKGRE